MSDGAASEPARTPGGPPAPQRTWNRRQAAQRLLEVPGYCGLGCAGVTVVRGCGELLDALVYGEPAQGGCSGLRQPRAGTRAWLFHIVSAHLAAQLLSVALQCPKRCGQASMGLAAANAWQEDMRTARRMTAKRRLATLARSRSWLRWCSAAADAADRIAGSSRARWSRHLAGMSRAWRSETAPHLGRLVEISPAGSRHEMLAELAAARRGMLAAYAAGRSALASLGFLSPELVTVLLPEDPQEPFDWTGANELLAETLYLARAGMPALRVLAAHALGACDDPAAEAALRQLTAWQKPFPWGACGGGEPEIAA